jgi:hypothetical protein
MIALGSERFSEKIVPFRDGALIKDTDGDVTH